jgi:hypothetical protein
MNMTIGELHDRLDRLWRDLGGRDPGPADTATIGIDAVRAELALLARAAQELEQGHVRADGDESAFQALKDVAWYLPRVSKVAEGWPDSRAADCVGGVRLRAALARDHIRLLEWEKEHPDWRRELAELRGKST